MSQLNLNNTDAIHIEDLKVHAKIGVLDWEKKVEQLLLVSVKLYADLSVAGQSDHLADTLDYVSIASKTQTLAVSKHFDLIEHYAACLAELMLEDERVIAVNLKINKPAAIAEAKAISVEMTRHSKQ